MRKLVVVFFAVLCVLIASARAQVVPQAPRPATGCNNNASNACNPGNTYSYYKQFTAGPIPLVTSSSGPQLANLGKANEIVDPSSGGTLVHFLWMVGSSNTVAWHNSLVIYDYAANAIKSGATIESYCSLNSGQIHDQGALIPGPNGSMLIPYCGISSFSGTANCMSSTGAGTGTSFSCMPYKIALPTASPSAVAAATQYFLPNAHGPSESWSTCFHRTPGDNNSFSNETYRCLWAGQNHNQSKPLNGGSIAMGLNQVGNFIHWTSTAGISWADTVVTPPTVGPDCPTNNCDELSPSGAYVPATTNLVNGAVQLTSTPGDNVWRVYQLTAGATSATPATITMPTLPSNGEPEAGNSCTVTFTPLASETASQVAKDFASIFNTGTVITGSSPSTTCSAWRSFYAIDESEISSSIYTLNCSTADPCLSFRILGSGGAYATNADSMQVMYQKNLPATITCAATLCTVFGTLGPGSSHPTLGYAAIDQWWGETAVMLLDVDNITANVYRNDAPSTGYGNALMLICYRGSDYNTSAQTWTAHSCNYGGTQTSCTWSPGNTVLNNNPATYCSPGVATGQGNGTSTNCPTVSPYLLPNPASFPSGMIPFNCDWTSANDAGSTGTGYPVAITWTQSPMPDGNLFVAFEQYTASKVQNVYGCVYDVVTALNDGCVQIDPGVSFNPAGNFSVQLMLTTGASGQMTLIIIAGESTAHSPCSAQICVMRYTATPTIATTIPSFTFQNAFAFSGQAQGNMGVCANDQQGGYHILCQVLSNPTNSANTASVSGLDFIQP